MYCKNMVGDGNVIKIIVLIILTLLCYALLKEDLRYSAIMHLVNTNSNALSNFHEPKVANELQKQRFLDGKNFVIRPLSQVV